VTPRSFDLALRVHLRRRLLTSLRGPWLPHDPEDHVVFQFVSGAGPQDRGDGLSPGVRRQHQLTVSDRDGHQEGEKCGKGGEGILFLLSFSAMKSI